MITVGRIVRPQGNRGEVMVGPATDFPLDRFRPGAVLTIRLRDERMQDVTITTSREHGGRWVLGFSGVTTIGEAESLRGLELRVAVEELRPLAPGSHYVHDLVGCRVETIGGRLAGSVRAVQFDAGVPLLVVDGEAGEVLIPFTEAICRQVDVAAKRIVVEPPEGLLELNAG